MVEITTETATSIIEDLRARNIELAKLVNSLQYRLAQRIQDTKNDYNELKAKFDVNKKQIFQIFLDNPEPMSYREIEEEVRVRLPFISMENADRRVRELFSEDLLWRDKNPDTNETRYCLKLKPEELKE